MEAHPRDIKRDCQVTKSLYQRRPLGLIEQSLYINVDQALENRASTTGLIKASKPGLIRATTPARFRASTPGLIAQSFCRSKSFLAHTSI